MSAPEPLPRWPKGPFPERYRFAAVEARLAGAWGEPARAAFHARLLGEGFRRVVALEDPWVRLLDAPSERVDASLRADARDAGVTAFVWSPPRRERLSRDGDPVPTEGLGTGRVEIGVVPTADPVDALSATGVAGPTHGIGMAAVVRFVVTLRSFAKLEILEMGEDRLVLSLGPNDERSLARIADRVLRLCPPLARAYPDPETLAKQIAATGQLDLDWA